MDHLLLHCEVAKEHWDLMLNLFGVLDDVNQHYTNISMLESWMCQLEEVAGMDDCTLVPHLIFCVEKKVEAFLIKKKNQISRKARMKHNSTTLLLACKTLDIHISSFP